MFKPFRDHRDRVQTARRAAGRPVEGMALNSLGTSGFEAPPAAGGMSNFQVRRDSGGAHLLKTA